MREFNLLNVNKENSAERPVGENLRKIENRIIATEKDERFFDGERNNGYGGFKYDGRWKAVAEKIKVEYKLNEASSFLHINCEKGFLLKDLKDILPKLNVIGLEKSDYARTNSMIEVRKFINKYEYDSLKNFQNKQFDFVMAMGVVYALNLTDAINCLKEINRISNKSFITLASYETMDEYWLFKNWTLLGATILKKNEWIKVMKYANYKGDYFFTNSNNLNLVWED